MHNDEYRRKIGAIEADTETFAKRNQKIEFEMDKNYNELFGKNESAKLYHKNIFQLKRAIATEKACIEELRKQVGEMRRMIHEEKAQRDEYLAHLHI